MDTLIIIGAGGLGLEIAGYSAGLFTVAGYLDDTKPAGTMHGGHPVLGTTDRQIDPTALYVIGLGLPEGRHILHEKFRAKGARFGRLIHPLAYVAPGAVIAEGCVIAPFAFVGAAAQLGANSFLNTHSCAGHETVVGAHSVLAPFACLHGNAVLGEAVSVGSHAVVTAGQRIGMRSRIAPGAVVYGAVPDSATALGNPARWRV